MWKLGFMQRVIIYLKIRIILFFCFIALSLNILTTILFMVSINNQLNNNNEVVQLESTVQNNETFYMAVIENTFYHLFPEIESSAFLTQRKLNYTDKLYRIKWLMGMMGIRMNNKDLEDLVNRTRAVNIVKGE